MKIVIHAQGSQDWLDWRLGGIGSSDAIILACHHGMIEKKPWMRSLDDLFQEKMTGVSPVVENDRMRRGTEFEPVARRAFETQTGIIVQPMCAEMDANNKIRASFDGITLDGLQTNEIKVPHEGVHELAKQGEIVEYYVPQVVHQALTAWGEPDQWPDNAFINFYTYDPDTKDGALVRKQAIEYREFGRQLYEHELAFLATLDQGVPPCGAQFASLAAKYLALDREIKQLTKTQDEYKSALIEIAKERGSNQEGGGVLVLQTKRAGTVDWNRLAAEYSIAAPEVEKYRGKEKTVWQVRTDPKAETVVPFTAAPRSATQAAAEVAVISDPFWGSFAQQSSTPRATHAA